MFRWLVCVVLFLFCGLSSASPAYADLESDPITVNFRYNAGQLTITIKSWNWTAQSENPYDAGLVGYSGPQISMADDFGHSYSPFWYQGQEEQYGPSASWPTLWSFAPMSIGSTYHLHVMLSCVQNNGVGGEQYMWDIYFFIPSSLTVQSIDTGDGAESNSGVDVTMDPTQGQLGSPSPGADPCLGTYAVNGVVVGDPNCTSSSGGSTGSTGGTTGSTGSTSGATGSTGSTGSTGGASNTPSFWQSLFEPSSSDLTQLRSAISSLETAGPWGSVAGLQSQVQNPAGNNSPYWPGLATMQICTSAGGLADTCSGGMTVPTLGHDFTLPVENFTSQNGAVEPVNIPFGGATSIMGWLRDLIQLVSWVLVAGSMVAFCLWLKGKVTV